MMTTCNCSDLCNYENIMTLIQTIFSVLAVILAWYIPEKIKWNQAYSSLSSEYQTYDFAIAVQGITEFFVIDCNSDPSKIKEEYKKRFIKEIYGIDDDITNIQDVIKKFNDSKNENNSFCLFITDVNKTLHFQRRLLTQFYCNFNNCSKSIFIGKKRVLKDFTTNEANLIRILILINEAINDDEILFKNLSCNERIPSPNRVKGINKSLSRVYHILRKGNRFIEE